MNTLFIAGHARLPAGMAAQNIYETLTITAEIDKNYSVIVSASCTLATAHGQEFVQQLLRGYSLQDGIEKPLADIKAHYLGKAGNALASALKDLFKHYESYKGSSRSS
ncbi:MULTISPECIES: DUF3870 domain-containing protein [Planococcus]|uniref:DUF3870 domain-containing protein n=1 Tax=Planococcus faecalis TaxID=1598147 RepID=A0ABN4XI82_9BACL|nr:MULTISPECIES: DUF3870 domain-containing protein [Planococcus]AQU78516.1 hypothetical protein AJGP001_04030 [Planococcus faecalis]MDJ0331520.1 DUF3870 domain-containing protein [Planococcus sp. S3-L1]OHX51483.1 hypothetical protein BB777_16735 [Planococcus faecalis]